MLSFWIPLYAKYLHFLWWVFSDKDSLVLKADSSFVVNVGNRVLDLHELGWDIPMNIKTASSFVHVLSIVSRSQVCQGCRKAKYSILLDTVYDSESHIQSVARLASFGPFHEASPSFKAFISVKCKIMISSATKSKVCEECQKLDNALQVRSFRASNIVAKEAIHQR